VNDLISIALTHAQINPEYSWPIYFLVIILVVWKERNKIRNSWANLKVFCNNFKNKLTTLWRGIPTHWKIVFFIILLVLVACVITYISQPHTSPAPVTPSKFTILVAKFDWPKDDEGLRQPLINRLREEMKVYKIVESQIKPLAEVKNPESDPEYNSEDIKEQYGKQGNAYISASYTASIYTLIYHFVLLHPPKDMLKFDFTRELTIHLPPSSEEKTNFINEMVYLSRFALGMNYYEEGESETKDMKKRIKQFSSAIKVLDDASNQKLSPEPALDKKLVLCYKGIAYYKQSDYKSARDILEKASLDGKGGNFHKDCPNEAALAFNDSDEEMNRKTSGSGGGGGGGGGGSLLVK